MLRLVNAVLDFLSPSAASTYYVVGKGIPAEETACGDLVEALGMASELVRTRRITVYVCELKAKVAPPDFDRP